MRTRITLGAAAAVVVLAGCGAAGEETAAGGSSGGAPAPGVSASSHHPGGKSQHATYNPQHRAHESKITDRSGPARIPGRAKGPYAVLRVVDGDTVHIAYKGADTTVRLIGIDTPEVVDPRKPVQCFGEQASAHAHKLLDGQRVYVATDPTQGNRDKYGRLLAYLWRASDGRFVNLNMVRRGYAHEYTYSASYRYQSEFIDAETAANSHDRGLWSPATCDGDTDQGAEPAAEPVAEPTHEATHHHHKKHHGGGLDPRFGTCGEANDHGYGPYVQGQDPEYDWYIDADSDGVDCEP